MSNISGNEKSTKYVVRNHKKQKLMLRGLNLIHKLYMHRPHGPDNSERRYLQIHISSLIHLRSGWTDEDYERAWVALEKLERKHLGKNGAPVSDNYQKLLNALLDVAESFAVTPVEKADAMQELLTMSGLELNSFYGETPPPNPQDALLPLLATDSNPMPKWVLDALVEYITKLRASDAIYVCNTLYDRLAALTGQEVGNALSSVKEEEENPDNITFG